MNAVKTLHIITEPTRFRLLQLLFEHHYCVKALSKKLDISEPAVSQHMSVLKKYNIVQGVKIGYQVHYQVNRKLIDSLLNELLQQVSQYPPEIEMTKDWDCTCEFISECIKRDSKILEKQGYEK
ncbi:winged helix-turn-helix transcriptional regulator [Clostridium sp. D2Q-14]|uniref:ArsR/SmtB family transcription factor n=1 Tax=Anaeromonas gelatinilytica TaxID=2683194 RepID=UPI00193C3152|nr:metalloregulator ArsR/SmtB family transcription factor [Anaeromonas gelatinilytica]MBS4534336.1 winged helix-turn-helix transcriptional regulator [Anaeromonas gelatinilytica]